MVNDSVKDMLLRGLQTMESNTLWRLKTKRSKAKKSRVGT